MWERAYKRIIENKKIKSIDDRRKYNRERKEPFPVYCNIHGISHSGTILNMSDGGFFLKLDSRIFGDEIIEFTLKPEGEEPANVSGRVAWMNSEGVGIRYIQ